MVFEMKIDAQVVFAKAAKPSPKPAKDRGQSSRLIGNRVNSQGMSKVTNRMTRWLVNWVNQTCVAGCPLSA